MLKRPIDTKFYFKKLYKRRYVTPIIIWMQDLISIENVVQIDFSDEIEAISKLTFAGIMIIRKDCYDDEFYKLSDGKSNVSYLTSGNMAILDSDAADLIK